MGGCEVKFGNLYKSDNLYLSHIRVLNYAMSNIPQRNKGNRTSWSFIDDLKEPISPGQV